MKLRAFSGCRGVVELAPSRFVQPGQRLERMPRPVAPVRMARSAPCRFSLVRPVRTVIVSSLEALCPGCIRNRDSVRRSMISPDRLPPIIQSVVQAGKPTICRLTCLHAYLSRICHPGSDWVGVFGWRPVSAALEQLAIPDSPSSAAANPVGGGVQAVFPCALQPGMIRIRFATSPEMLEPRCSCRSWHELSQECLRLDPAWASRSQPLRTHQYGRLLAGPGPEAASPGGRSAPL